MTVEGVQVTVEVLNGSLTLNRIEVAGIGQIAPGQVITIKTGEAVSWHL